MRRALDGVSALQCRRAYETTGAGAGKAPARPGGTLGAGVFFSLDYWTFGRWLPQVRESYESGLLTRRPDNWLASVFYGGVVEELLLRLFFLSLLAFFIWKVFFGNLTGNVSRRGCSLQPTS